MNKNEIKVTIKEIQDFKNGDFLKLLRRRGAPLIKDGKDLMLDPQYDWHTRFDDKDLMYVVSWK